MQISVILSDYDGTLFPTMLSHNSGFKNEAFTNNDYSKIL
jgi:hypothetical protein